MSDFKVGNLIKITTKGGIDRVGKLEGFTKGSRIIPDDWLVIEGKATNPNRCSLYTGATSCLPDQLIAHK